MMKNTKKPITNKLTIPLFATVLIAALSCVIQITHATSKIASATPDDNEINLKEGPPLSVAFHSNSVRTMSGSRQTEVFVMNPDGTDQTRITFNDRTDQQPDISPDGRQIVWA